MKEIKIAFLFITIVSCSSREEYVQEELYSYYEEYKALSFEYGVEDNTDKYDILIYIDPKLNDSKSAWGLCIKRRKTRTIIIDSSWFYFQKKNGYEERILAMMLHECGHCFKGFKHGDNKIMEVGNSNGNNFERNKEEQLKEFFE